MRLFIRGIARNLDHQRNALGTVKVPSARTYRAAQIVNMWWVWEPSRYEGGGDGCQIIIRNAWSLTMYWVTCLGSGTKNAAFVD